MRTRRQTLRLCSLATLNRCVSAGIGEHDAQLQGAFAFSRQRCKGDVLSFLGAQTVGVCVCMCQGERFDMAIGRADYVVSSSPPGDVAEVELMRECEARRLAETLAQKEFQSQMRSVCASGVQNFEIIAAFAGVLQTGAGGFGACQV